LPPNTITGGTGYGKFAELPPEVDKMFPDYSIYPDCDYALGYITRGFPNNCRWCCVPQKEENIRAYSSWQEIIRPESDKIVLMDNNILACDYGIKQLAELSFTDYKIDLNQGMDARLVTEEIADIIAHIKRQKYIRFSCDKISQVSAIFYVAEMLKKRGIKPWRLSVYLLVTSDLENAEKRVHALKKLKGIMLYAQAERNAAKGIAPNASQLEYCQKYVFKGLYKKESWREYC